MTTPNPEPNKPLRYVNANVSTLCKVFQPFQVQSFINWSPQWAPQKNKWLKRPVQSISNPFTHMSLTKAAAQSTTLGLVCNEEHQIIAIDIDGVHLSTPAIQSLISSHPTYTEKSPSGKANHYRLLYALPSTEDKSLLKRKGTAIPHHQPDDATHAIELYNASTNFVTLTGEHIKSSPLTIAEITPTIITDLFPEFKASPIIDIKTRKPTAPQPASVLLVPASHWINEVPCRRDDPALLAFLGKHSLIYHDYWLLGLMAIQAAYGSIQGFPVADQWSKSSGDDYDETELAQRWESISDPNYEMPKAGMPKAVTSITPGTYQWMFNEFSIQWPVLNGKTKQPKSDELENFQAFLAYKGLTPEVDVLTGVCFLDGEDYALYPTYYANKENAYSAKNSDLGRLAARLVQEAQPYKFRPTTTQVVTWLKDLILIRPKTLNRFAREVINKPPYDPDTEPDYITQMGKDIIQRNEESEAPTQEFHELLVRKWLLSLGRNLWPEITQKNPNDLIATSEGVLILSSPKGGINKSSFGVRLFPPEWRHLHITTEPRLSGMYADKDSLQKTVGKLVVDFDEAERIFKRNDASDLKAYLTERSDSFRPPYGRDVEEHTRFFSCMASTNMVDMTFPREGARRYWWLNVSYVDTYAMDKMDMYNLWRQILYELRVHTGQRAPYILNVAETKYLESYLCDHTTTNSTEELLNDLYDFSEEGFKKYTSGRLTKINSHSMSITEISNKVFESSRTTPSSKNLKHAVTSLLKRHAPDIYVSSKLVKGGTYTLRRQQRYFMPEERNDALRRAAENDLD